MVNQNPKRPSSSTGRFFRKFLLSALVVFSFVLYALHKSFTGADNTAGVAAPGTQAQNAQVIPPTTAPSSDGGAGVPQTGGSSSLPPLASPTPSSQQGSNPTSAPPQQALIPTAVPARPTTPSKSGLKDGTYTGPQVDAFYGLVQVQTVIQNGKIKSVQFLQYPQDRRTSARINQVAVPYLQQEALQAQSANVNIITGATLTSEAFMMSLQSALGKAGG
jgi:uncharacterized protein with FMN-binding domain